MRSAEAITPGQNASTSTVDVCRQSKRPAQLAAAFALLLLIAGSVSRETTAVSLEPAAGQTSSGEWLKFDTDACGQLGRVEGPGSALVERAAGDDEDKSDDEDDDYSWSQVWGIPDEDSSQAEQWHLDHPRVAIVTDAIARSCETDPSDVDAPDAEELA